MGEVVRAMNLKFVTPHLEHCRLLDQAMAQFADMCSLGDCMITRIQDLELEQSSLLERPSQLVGQPVQFVLVACSIAYHTITHVLNTTDLVP